MKTHRKPSFINQRGFTLIEIMVVVIIISILTAVVAPNLFPQVYKAQKIKAETDIKSISGQLSLYKLDNYKFPSSGEGLKSLVNDNGKKTWNGPYMDSLPKDPWDNEYQYQYPGTKNPRGFDLWSLGADGAPGGEGEDRDLGNWQEPN